METDSITKPGRFHFQSMALGKCDACGCSASGGSMGFGSFLTSRFVGVRYIYQQYSSSDGLYANSPWYKESYNSIQVWGRIPVFKNAQISVLAPYHFNSRDTETGSHSIQGIGDITVLGLYKVVQTKTDTTFFAHTVQLGAGVKAPTGTYDALNNGSINPGFQLGTGSWDYLFLIEHTVKRKKFGLGSMVNYVVKTVNDKGYRFGNQFNYASTLFWLHEQNDFSFSPQLGLAGEVSASNYQYGQEVEKTKGNILFGRIGFETALKKFSLGMNALLPLSQDLTGGRVDAKFRLGVNLNYSL
ncbi:transporter [Flavobacterium silvaticum]|nr:transporter [Flavobacterium silvaticum]